MREASWINDEALTMDLRRVTRSMQQSIFVL